MSDCIYNGIVVILKKKGVNKIHWKKKIKDTGKERSKCRELVDVTQRERERTLVSCELQIESEEGNK